MRPLARAALAAALALPAAAFAQDPAGPSPEEIKAKVLEIERLMKSAETALARSTDTRTAAERSAEAAKKLLDEKSRAETGKSAEDLRKDAASGSKEAAETLERLTKSAESEAKSAAEKLEKILSPGGSAGGSSSGSGDGIKKLIEVIKGEGKEASQGIEWILKQAKGGGGGGGGGGGSGKPKEQPKDAPDAPKPDPKKPNGDKDPSPSAKKPESGKEPPRSPEFEQWVAELPPQVRKAYETEDWDSIPPKWREMLKEWTRKMAEDLEKERDKR